MYGAGLSAIFPPEAWPAAEAVSELAAKAKALKARYNRSVAPYCFVDLKKFLPAYCPEFVQVRPACTCFDTCACTLGVVSGSHGRWSVACGGRPACEEQSSAKVMRLDFSPR